MLFDVLSMLSLVAAVGVEFHPLFMKKISNLLIFDS